MTRARRLLCALTLFAAWSMAGQEHPNRESGFTPDRVFHIGELDHVNLFNGNLVVTIPVDGTYPVGGALSSYGLSLVYAGNIWKISTVCGRQDNCRYVAAPNVRSAGLGWVISMGRLIAPGREANASSFWMYESPDGGLHEFYGVLHEGDLEDDFDTAYTRDNTYLRLKSSTRQVEFGNGTTHAFDTSGRLTQMRDKFGNAVNLSYSADGLTTTISDPHGRSHVIRYETLAQRNVVSSIELATVGGALATYTFTYAETALRVPCIDTAEITAATVTVPVLQKLELPVVNGVRQTYEFTIDTGGTTCASGDPATKNLSEGVLRLMTFPTRGAVRWSYDLYELPSELAGGETTHVPGVVQRALINKADVESWQTASPAAAWTYTSTRNVPVSGYRVQKVTDPSGAATEHYFSEWHTDPAADGSSRADYALPFTRAVTDGSSPSRYLSSKSFAADDTHLRSSYVRYEYDYATCDSATSCNRNRNRREKTTRIVYVDDGNVFAEVMRSKFDGLGHYREQTTGGSFDSGNVRTEFTNYNPDQGTYDLNTDGTVKSGFSMLPSGFAWTIGTFTETRSTERSILSDTDVTATVEYSFDSFTGALKRRRTRAAAERGAHDLLAVYTVSVAGNVEREEFYGGDFQTLATGELGSVALPAKPEYRIDHTYGSGVRTSSRYYDTAPQTAVALPFKSFDVAVDPSTGQVTASRDVAGATTTYTYDALRRLRVLAPPGDAATEYVYTDPTQAAPAKVKVNVRPNGNLAGTPLSEQEFAFDDFGRVIRDSTRLPGGVWSHRATTYDTSGRIASRSEAYTGAAPVHLTSYDYDAFGRTITVHPPDHGEEHTHDVSTTYRGVRTVSRTVRVNAEAGEQPATTTEVYDRQGRLLSVTEASGEDGEAITTTYTYDIGNRLARVSTPARTGTPQTRTFEYDHRGFLLHEFHPEKGINGHGSVDYGHYSGTTFIPQYNSRGHARRRVDSLMNGPFDVTFTFDAAERLTGVEDLAPGAGTRRALKSFTYGTANVPAGCTPSNACDAQLGKLVSATRWNAFTDLGTIAVEQTFQYLGRGGRLSHIASTVSDGTDFSGASFDYSQTWEEIGSLASVTYPATAAMTAPARTVTYTYTMGRLTSVAGYATIAYQANGLVSQIAHTNSVTETWTADPHGMPRPRSISVGGANALSWTYGDYAYDGAGNIAKIGPTSYHYDGAMRLRSWTREGNTATRAVDRFGNHTQSRYKLCTNAELGDCYETSMPVPAVNGRTNRYTGHTYDHAGNLVGDGTTSYAYDAVSMLKSLDVGARAERYVYTADDERIAVVHRVTAAGGTTRNRTMWTLRDGDARLLRTFTDDNTSGTRTWTWTEDEVFRGTQILASESASGTRRYHLDHLGSPRLITDAAGTRIGEQKFEPFGEGGSLDGGRLQFTGHERDVRPGDTAGPLLDYMHARYYNARMGRFLSVDPYLDIEEALHEPQLWNRYSYVTNNPLKFTDPDGRYRTFYKEKPMTAACCAPPSVSWSFYAQAALLGGGPILNRLAPYLVSLGLALAPRAPQIVDMFGPPGHNVVTPSNVGMWREEIVAKSIGGTVSGAKLTVKNVGSTDVDVIGKAGEYIAVGGPAKGFDMAKFGQKLDILKRGAAEAGVPAKAYLAEGTPQKVIDLAKKKLGEDNVVIFRIVQ